MKLTNCVQEKIYYKDMDGKKQEVLNKESMLLTINYMKQILKELDNKEKSKIVLKKIKNRKNRL